MRSKSVAVAVAGTGDVSSAAAKRSISEPRATTTLPLPPPPVSPEAPTTRDSAAGGRRLDTSEPPPPPHSNLRVGLPLASRSSHAAPPPPIAPSAVGACSAEPGRWDMTFEARTTSIGPLPSAELAASWNGSTSALSCAASWVLQSPLLGHDTAALMMSVDAASCTANPPPLVSRGRSTSSM
eukprot:scaffold155881_cov27-Tisochrysis_lutea.AAC.4